MSITYSRNAELAGSVPSVNIARNNSRQKRYNSETLNPIYYLNHKEEFQIELYNPTNHIVRCDISLNGKLIPGGGLVLKPAERVFLDRYFNTPNKFIFETYEVGNTNTNKKVIESNGSIKVQFYKEREPFSYGTCSYVNWNPNYTATPYYGTFITNNAGTTTTLGYTGNLTSTASSSTITTTSLLTDSPDPTRHRQIKAKSTKKIETGIIGKGSESNQKFTNVHYDFDYSPFYTIEYKLLPYSQKPQTLGTINIVRYCTECGAKIKKEWKFCSNCGSKV